MSVNLMMVAGCFSRETETFRVENLVLDKKSISGYDYRALRDHFMTISVIFSLIAAYYLQGKEPDGEAGSNRRVSGFLFPHEKKGDYGNEKA